ncbi:MAG TPA: HNH endonuclease, partial [Amycolatopsis sp.]
MERTEQVPVWQLSEEELTTELLAVERMLCRGYARMLEVVGEVDRRGVAVGKGFRSTAVMLVRALRVSQKEARARVTQATTALPVMRAALAAGDLN